MIMNLEVASMLGAVVVTVPNTTNFPGALPVPEIGALAAIR
jgi:hypothetical protein